MISPAAGGAPAATAWTSRAWKTRRATISSPIEIAEPTAQAPAMPRVRVGDFEEVRAAGIAQAPKKSAAIVTQRAPTTRRRRPGSFSSA